MYKGQDLMVAYQKTLLQKAVSLRRGHKTMTLVEGYSRLQLWDYVKNYARLVAMILIYTIAFAYIIFVQLAVVGINAFDNLLALGMWIYFFYDAVDLKISNRYLVEGSEVRLGFGQVLAVVLMFMPFLNVLDILNREFGVIKNEGQE